uniref:Bax inhibitor n=1 Tax=Scolopendra viridis TaxID=118503 RepID=A0A4D5R8V7_SCOVI
MANIRGVETFFQNLDAKLEPPLKLHLRNVYSCLSLSILTAAAGAYIHVFTDILKGSLWISLLGIVFLILLKATSNDGKNGLLRLGYLEGFALTSGLSFGPLLDMVIMIDPSIIPTALLGTGLIFICFTLAALLSNQRRWLYLGGTLMSLLSWLLLMSFLNLFFRSQFLFQIHVYGGLFLMCGFIAYDTQLILDKYRKGDRDFMWHSVELFIDFIEVFRSLLIILSQKEQKKKDKK